MTAGDDRYDDGFEPDWDVAFLDDEGLWDDVEELFEDRCPYDEPIGGSGPGPWDPEYGPPPHRGWKADLEHCPVPAERVAMPTDVFGPGLSRHTWLWRTVEAELASFAEEPTPLGDWMPLIVARVAEEMLATGPACLPVLVQAAVGWPMGDAGEVRRYVARELELHLRRGAPEPSAVPDDDHEDPVARLLARAVVQADFDRLAQDVESLAAELILRSGGAPPGLAQRVEDVLPTLGVVPATAAGPALEAAARLVGEGLIPVGEGRAGRVVAACAGFLMIGAGLGCEPGAIAMLLHSRSAARSLIRSRTRGLGPFGRYCDSDAGDVAAAWRSGGTVIVGPPGVGKTQMMIWLAAGAPGAVVAGTPNPLDIHEFAARATDEDVQVFDPGDLLADEVPPGIKVVSVDVMPLVADWGTASRVASLIVESAGNHENAANEQFWVNTSTQLLSALLFAAKSAGRPFSAVGEWLLQGDDAEVLGILARSGCPEAYNAFSGHMRCEDERTRGNIIAAAQADIRAMGTLRSDLERFDFDRFAAGRGTLIVLADQINSAASRSAVAFMTRQVVEAVFRRFGRGQAGPPTSVFIDEAARSPGLTPILAELLAQGPSRGVNPVAVCQTLEQFNAVPGGAKEITEAAARTLFFPGSMPSHLLGVAPFIEHETPDGGSTVLDPARLARPEDGTMHVLERSRLRRMRPYAAHQSGTWRMCNLDAAFSRAGAAPIAYL